MEPAANGASWALEVVRGRDAGRIFAIQTGKDVVLGNALGTGIDLSGQEGDSPRRMAGRHATLEPRGTGLTVRDLESPGGTFVNRQRVLPGQARPLKPGDVLQLGAVQLRVVAAAPVPVPAASPSSKAASPIPFSYPMAGGTTCRSWDDWLAVSAQRWEAVREELTSGRLAAWLTSIGRSDLMPPATGSPDERLDAWLGRLPTVRPGQPELDVHPSRLVIRATPGGGTVRRSVQVANVGHRLLRSNARIEPPGLAWLTIAPEFARGPFTTVEGTELPVEVAIPADLPAPLRAVLVIEGNGGTKRVEVVLEAKPAATDPAGPPQDRAEPTTGDARLSALIARQPPVVRVATWSLAALAGRLLIGVAGGAIGADAMTASGPDAPRLGGVALALAAVGAVVGGGLAAKQGGAREAPTGSFAGAGAGVVVAALLVATCRSIEPVLQAWATSIPAVCALWASLGAGLAGVSIVLIGKGQP